MDMKKKIIKKKKKKDLEKSTWSMKLQEYSYKIRKEN